MWKYIITWVTFYMSAQPCPDRIVGCTVFHSHKTYNPRQAVIFYDRNTVIEHLNNLSDGVMFVDSLTVDSIYVPKPIRQTK